MLSAQGGVLAVGDGGSIYGIRCKNKIHTALEWNCSSRAVFFISFGRGKDQNVIAKIIEERITKANFSESGA